MTKDEEGVLQANENFYHALQELSLDAMEAVWLTEDWVRCVHPGWEILEGWESIRESWQQIFAGTQFMRVVVGIQAMYVEQSVAWVSCSEKISSAADGRFDSASVQATNIFHRRNGSWLLVLHHASHRPAPAEAAGEVVQ
jgi:ketosteroid isomerase-like protein